MENNIVRFKCPHCHQPLAFKRPEKGDSVGITCPQCKNHINIKIREKAIHLPGQEPPTHEARPRLMLTDGSQRDFVLRHGSNIIGRKDTDVEQDIAIDGDPTISRRSLEIQVSLATGGGCAFRLKVLNAKNPVYVNNSPLHVGNSITLRPGDTLMLGGTKMKLCV